MEQPSSQHSINNKYWKHLACKIHLSCKHLFCNKYTYLIIVVAALALLYIFNPIHYWFWPKCPFKLITHLSCPACGLQRFLHALTHGDVKQACHYNYYLIYALPYALAVILTYYMPNGKIKERMARIFEGKIAIWTYVVTFCIWFVVINILHI